ncbi:MAG: methyltransferase [Acetobacteraceae bacterium]
MAGWREIGLRPSLGCFLPRIKFNVGNHAAVEDRLAVGLAIVDAIEADDGALKVHAHLPRDAHQFGHVEGARLYVEEAGVAERCRLLTGDFFQSVPEAADAYILKSVLHVSGGVNPRLNGAS